MNNNLDLEKLEDARAVRREQKRKPRMKQSGKGLKQKSVRSVLRIHKVTKK